MIEKLNTPLYFSENELLGIFGIMLFVICVGAEILRVVDFFREKKRKHYFVRAPEPVLKIPVDVLALPFPTEECRFNNQCTDGKIEKGIVDSFIFKVNLNDGGYRWTCAPIKTLIKQQRRM